MRAQIIKRCVVCIVVCQTAEKWITLANNGPCHQRASARLHQALVYMRIFAYIVILLYVDWLLPGCWCFLCKPTTFDVFVCCVESRVVGGTANGFHFCLVVLYIVYIYIFNYSIAPWRWALRTPLCEIICVATCACKRHEHPTSWPARGVQILSCILGCGNNKPINNKESRCVCVAHDRQDILAGALAGEDTLCIRYRCDVLNSTNMFCWEVGFETSQGQAGPQKMQFVCECAKKLLFDIKSDRSQICCIEYTIRSSF